jgi:putative ABC transport system substrate-binding protein
VDGQTVSLEFRFANDALERLPALAAELVATQPDVIWTWTSGAARAAASATSTIPIVVSPVNEAVMLRLVKDIAHPAGNVTGATLNSRLQHEKCLQLLKEVAPQITRVGVLVNPLNPAWDDYPAVLNEAARMLGLELIRAEARGASEIDQAFAALIANGGDALFAINDGSLAGADVVPRRILELIKTHRLPSVSDAAQFVRQGGLLALGVNDYGIAHRGAFFVHRILQGAKPGDLPVELPTEFRLIVNLKAAAAIGLVVPPAIMAAADEVIE